MKYILLSIFLTLCVATVIDHSSRLTVQSEVPILYWVTGVNKAREEQIELFYKWLEKKDYPKFEVRLDSTNSDASKKLIQGVSGVGADIISMARDEAWLFHATGMMEDLRPLAKLHGFTLDKTWSAAAPSFIIDGDQVGFPRGNSVQMHFLNMNLFEQYGLPLPPENWTINEFEQAAKAFVAAANADARGPTKTFFADMVNVTVLHRGMGRSVFNETMTRCTLNTPEIIRTFKLLRKWIYVDRIIPTQADLDFFAGSDTNTSRIQLFAQGRYAMLTGARYSLIQLRDHPDLRLTARMTPYDCFPNAMLGTGSVGIYKRSQHKNLAAYLLEFFTSEEYNRQVVQSGESVGPIPAYTKTEEYLYPKKYPGEWGIHGKIADLMDIAITPCASPFILPSSFNRIESEYRLATLAGIYTPVEGAALGEGFANRQIEQNVRDDPELKRRYENLLKDQERIEQLRAAGEKVPSHLITNPFYQRYYRERGWSTDT